MATNILMPKLGLTMESGTITRWLKEAGSEVAKGEALAEVETDKATVQIEAEASGNLGAILFREGATVPVGQVIAYVVAPGEHAPVRGPAVSSLAVKDEVVANQIKAPATAPPVHRGVVPVSPRARRLAEELRVDLSNVVGSGPNGRIIEEDVRRAAESSSR